MPFEKKMYLQKMQKHQVIWKMLFKKRSTHLQKNKKNKVICKKQQQSSQLQKNLKWLHKKKKKHSKSYLQKMH